jgi:asparagine synthase (glutamine-hydrolysing)
MGDFLLDLRPHSERRLATAADRMRFMDHLQVVTIDEPEFGLVLTFTFDAELWTPYRSPDGSLVAVAGRVALDEKDWRAGESVPGLGALAAKAILAIYRTEGVAGLEQLTGNCLLLVHDAAQQTIHLLTDCAGVFPAFRLDTPGQFVFGSHPDVVAQAGGVEKQWDEPSFAEFVLTGSVTFPFTYYQKVRALEPGTTFTLRLGQPTEHQLSARRNFDISFQPESNANVESLGEELAAAFQNATRRRTLPRLGRTAVALSGGLDSRAILASMENRDQAFAFCCYNEPNRELRTAQAIAQSQNTPFLAWPRPFEYYGQNAELGVRISGGMGTFANNHFLGITDRLLAENTQNLLTGCYCDYLFKGLPLNRRTNRLTGREEIAPFRHQFYFGHYSSSTQLAQQARERYESRVPAALQSDQSDAALFDLEVRRTFPLNYEPDNQQRLVPQRVTGWSVPMADRKVLEVYRKIPSRLKLNRALFLETVRALCPPAVLAIPDANTGASLNASAFSTFIAAQRLRINRRLRRLRQSIATDESWPDWEYYVPRSEKLKELWSRPNPGAVEMLTRIVGRENMHPTPAHYTGNKLFLFVSMLSLKIWLDQRLL